mmetsp:Transcript_13276/g.25150  ORF Transcript_13276/g.25150 Transcript_13276/m.25150 type:complete len:89 (-) Transcript_13276:1327-1593(-)
MNIMYVRRKTNTTAVAANNHEESSSSQAKPQTMMRRFRSKRSLLNHEKDAPLKQSPSLTKKPAESLADLHSELQVLAALGKTRSRIES